MRRAEAQPEEIGALPIRQATPKGRKALARLKRELTEDEASQPGVHKMIVEELERVEGENRELRGFRDKFHEVDKRVAILETERGRSIAWEVLSTGSISVGSVMVGFASSVWSSQPIGWQVLACGSVLLVIGIVSRCVRL